MVPLAFSVSPVAMGLPAVIVALVIAPPEFVGVRVVTAPTVSVIERALTAGATAFTVMVTVELTQPPVLQ